MCTTTSGTVWGRSVRGPWLATCMANVQYSVACACTYCSLQIKVIIFEKKKHVADVWQFYFEEFTTLCPRNPSYGKLYSMAVPSTSN